MSGGFFFRGEFMLTGLTELLSLPGQSLADYSDLDTRVAGNVMVNDSGALCTLIRVEGCRVQPLQSIFAHLLDRMSGLLNRSMKKPGHVIHCCESHEPGFHPTLAEINRITAPNRAASKMIGLDLEWLEERRNWKLANYSSLVESYVAIWTTPEAIFEKNSPTEVLYPNGGDEEILGVFSKNLLNKHANFLNQVVLALSEGQFQHAVMDAYSAGRMIRKQFNPDECADTWQPALLPSDIRHPVQGKAKVLRLPPPLRQQVTPGKAVMMDFERFRLGKRIYASFDLRRFPSEAVTFKGFAQNAAGERLPYRFGLCIRSNGSGQFKNRFGRWFKRISLGKPRDTLTAQEFFEDAGGVVVSAQASITTWVDTADYETEEKARMALDRNVQTLKHLVQTWGNADIDSKNTDPLNPYCNTIPGLRLRNTAPVTYPSLEGAVELLPAYSLARVWQDTCNVLFRSPMGELLPFRLYSPQQPYNVVLIQGTPGTGKSNLINDLILGIARAPGNTTLPLIGVVDVKPSSFGAMRLLQYALPEGKKHWVVTETLDNDPSKAINPNDTLYGARYPTANQAIFQRNFWTLLCQPLGTKEGLDAISNGMDLILSECFRQLDDQREGASPARYQQGGSPLLDSWLIEYSVDVGPETTYWSLFDKFHDMGHHDKAAHIQTLAMPNVGTMINVARSAKMQSMADTLTLPNGRPVMEHISTLLSNISSTLPVFAGSSKVSLGDARCVSLDIEPLIDNGSEEGCRVSAAAYMLATHLVTSQFYLKAQDVEEVAAPKYHDFLIQRVRDLEGLSRTAIFDEMHSMSMPSSQSQFSEITKSHIIRNIRVHARSGAVGYILASQLADEFQGAWTDLYTNAILFKTGSLKSGRLTCETYDLPEDFADALAQLEDPNASGSSFLFVNNVSGVKYIQAAKNTLPAEQLWGTTTTRDDRLLLERALQHYGDLQRALDALTRAFPSGSCVSKAEEIRRTMKTTPTSASRSVIAQLMKIVTTTAGIE